jgi:hypothetical protein
MTAAMLSASSSESTPGQCDHRRDGRWQEQSKAGHNRERDPDQRCPASAPALAKSVSEPAAVAVARYPAVPTAAVPSSQTSVHSRSYGRRTRGVTTAGALAGDCCTGRSWQTRSTTGCTRQRVPACGVGLTGGNASRGAGVDARVDSPTRPHRAQPPWLPARTRPHPPRAAQAVSHPPDWMFPWSAAPSPAPQQPVRRRPR